MDRIINIIKEHKELWFLIPILMYVISFTTEYLYFAHFKIDIIYYFSPLSLIFSFASIFITPFLIGTIHLAATLGLRFVLHNTKHKHISLRILSLAIFLILYISKRYSQFSLHYDLAFSNYTMMYMIVFCISTIDQIKNNGLAWLGASFVLICCFTKNYSDTSIHYAQSGFLNAVSFNYNGEFVHSNASDKIYIGETTDFLFLYNNQNECSQVFKKSNIDSLIIKKPAQMYHPGKIISENYEYEELKQRIKLHKLNSKDSVFLKLSKEPKTTEYHRRSKI